MTNSTRNARAGGVCALALCAFVPDTGRAILLGVIAIIILVLVPVRFRVPRRAS